MKSSYCLIILSSALPVEWMEVEEGGWCPPRITKPGFLLCLRNLPLGVKLWGLRIGCKDQISKIIDQYDSDLSSKKGNSRTYSFVSWTCRVLGTWIRTAPHLKHIFYFGQSNKLISQGLMFPFSPSSSPPSCSPSSSASSSSSPPCCSPVFQSRQWCLWGATAQTLGSLVVYVHHPPENNCDDDDDDDARSATKIGLNAYSKIFA